MRRATTFVSLAVESVARSLVGRQRASMFCAFESLEDRTLFGYGWNRGVEVADPQPTAISCPPDQLVSADPNGGAVSSGSETSNAPVNYFSGHQTVTSTDLSSDAFGQAWNYTRTWTGLNESGQNGNGWSIDDQPYLVIKQNQYYYAHGGIVQLVNGNTVEEFVIGMNDTTFKPRYSSQNTLTYIPPSIGAGGVHLPGEFHLTDAQGDVTAFYDLPRSPSSEVSGTTYGRIYGGTGYANQVTNQWFDPTTGVASSSASPYRFGAFKSYTDASTHLTITATYDASGNLSAMTRTDGSGVYERYAYQYSTITNDLGGSASLISSVTLQRSTNLSGPWTKIRGAEYSYYTGATTDASSEYGRLGDLELVVIKDFEKNAGGDVVDHKYYRYNKLYGQRFDGSYLGDYNYLSTGPTNDMSTTGGTDTTFTEQSYDNYVASGLKAVFEGAFFARLAASRGSLADFGDDPDVDVNPYANYTFTYERVNPGDATYDEAYGFDTKYRISQETAAGNGCSTCSSGFGTYKFEYYTGGHTYDTASDMSDISHTADYANSFPTNSWVMRTTEYLPDSTPTDWTDNDQNIVYTNGIGEVMLKILVDKHGTASTSDDKYYLTYNRYDDQGRLIATALPSAFQAASDGSLYNESYGDLIDWESGSSYLNSTSGLIESYDYDTATTTATATAAGDVLGYLMGTYVQQGIDGTPLQVSGRQYYAHSYNGAFVYPVATTTEYRDVDGNGTNDAINTTISYTWALDSSSNETNRIATRTISYPAVATSRNGAGTTSTEVTVFDSVGRPVWVKGRDGFITYLKYDNATGALVKQIDDVDTSKTTSFSGLPTGWSTPTGGGLHLTTTMQVDGLGRPTAVTDPNGNVTYTVYNDANHETRTYRSAPGAFSQVGPVYIRREYWPSESASSGETQAYTEAIISSATPSLTGGVPDGTESLSSSNIQALSRYLTNDAGQVIESDVYTDLSGVTYGVATPTLGAIGVNYLATTMAYDDRGRLKRVQTPDGTITRNLYDARGLLLSTWKGTDDTPASGYWSPTNESGANLVKIASDDYDIDGDLIISRQVLSHDTTTGADQTYYQTTYGYDFRDRLTDMRGPDEVATKYTLDNSGNQIQTQTYVDLNSNFAIDSGEAIGKSTDAYDERDQVYRSSVYQNSRALDSGALTSTGTTATVKLANHGFSSGQSVTIAGASQSAYDGTFIITVVDANTFTFTIPASTTSPATGSRITVTANKSLTTNYWYDARGNQVKTQDPNGLITKTFYDGAGRVNQTDISADATETASGSYADALTLTGDQVIEEYDYYLDQGGRTRIVTDWKRDGSQYFTGTGQPYDSSNYDHNSTAYYFDAANRLIATANFGRDGTESGSSAADHLVIKQYTHSYVDVDANGIPDVIDHADGYDPGLSNSTSSTSYEWIYTGYSYDAAGRLKYITDNAGKGTGYYYDLAGRQTDFVRNGEARIVIGATDFEDNASVYDAFGRLTRIVPLSIGLGGSEITKYVYGSDVDRSWVTATLFPDSTATVSTDSAGKGTVSGTDAAFSTYDRLGRKVTETDQRGIVHTYTYDSAGRLSSDSIGTGTLPTGIDGTVRTIAYTYDDQSRVSTVSSLDASGATVNQVAYTYDGWGNVTKDAEEHNGAVTSTTPAVNYYYDDGSGTGTTAKYVRINKVLYPKSNGGSVGTFTYSYESWATGAALNRLQYLRDGNGLQLVQYQWLGANTLTNTILHPQVSGGLTMNDGSSGSHYLNLDRYYRNAVVQWQNTSGSTQFQQLLYTYDRMGNVLTKDNNSAGTGAGNWDETFSYDGLNRLVDYKRGSLSSGTISGSSLKFEQTWSLDVLGNWAGYTQTNNDTTLPANFTTFTQTRTANAANEITGTTGTSGMGGTFAATTYDASGNQTAGPKTGSESTQLGYVYDGWNRLVGVDANHDGDLYDAGDVRYSYDGTGRRITKFTDSTNDGTNDAGSTEEYYQNEQNQVLEVRVGTVTGGVKSINANPKERYLWDLNYVDAPAMVELDTNTDGTRDYRLWPTWDANHNITSLVSDHGQTVERYEYTPYGQQIVLNGSNNYAGTGADPDGADWSVDTNGSDFGFMLGFQGLRFNPESGDWETDSRIESPNFGFIQRDPLGYTGSMNLYQLEGNDPVMGNDPSGKIQNRLAAGTTVAGASIGGGNSIADLTKNSTPGTIVIINGLAIMVPIHSLPQGPSDGMVAESDSSSSNTGIAQNGKGCNNGCNSGCIQKALAAFEKRQNRDDIRNARATGDFGAGAITAAADDAEADIWQNSAIALGTVAFTEGAGFIADAAAAASIAADAQALALAIQNAENGTGSMEAINEAAHVLAQARAAANVSSTIFNVGTAALAGIGAYGLGGDFSPINNAATAATSGLGALGTLANACPALDAAINVVGLAAAGAVSLAEAQAKLPGIPKILGEEHAQSALRNAADFARDVKNCEGS